VTCTGTVELNSSLPIKIAPSLLLTVTLIFQSF
jgi:hypothetical protein